MFSARFFTMVFVASAVFSMGCGDKEKSGKCKANEVHDCVCQDDHASLQTCNANGTWNACMCPGSGTAGSGTAGASGMGASGDGAGTGASGTSGDDDSGISNADGGSEPMTDGGTPGDDAAVAVEYSGPCTKKEDCAADETCDVATKVCGATCTMANGADCPAPPNGTATKTCTIPLLALMGTCSLTCSSTLTCPTGMMCTVGFTSVCTWP